MTSVLRPIKNPETDVDYKQSKGLPTVTKEGSKNLSRFSYRYQSVLRVFVLRVPEKKEPEITEEKAVVSVRLLEI
jgi:hypothetical protein